MEEADQSALTGESLPAERKAGEAVFSCSIVGQIASAPHQSDPSVTDWQQAEREIREKESNK